MEELPAAAPGGQHSKGRRRSEPLPGSRGRRRWRGKGDVGTWQCRTGGRGLTSPLLWIKRGTEGRSWRRGQVRLGQQETDDPAAGWVRHGGGRR